MKKVGKITGKILLWIVLALVVGMAVLLLVRQIGRSVNAKTPAGGINESMLVDINGTQQWISIYGQDKDAPVLLYLHGGPGSATSHLDYAFTRKWSDVYTVVTWDQRNCGKSFATSQTDPITADIMMQDGKEMTEFLLDHLDKEKITLPNTMTPSSARGRWSTFMRTRRASMPPPRSGRRAMRRGRRSSPNGRPTMRTRSRPCGHAMPHWKDMATA